MAALSKMALAYGISALAGIAALAVILWFALVWRGRKARQRARLSELRAAVAAIQEREAARAEWRLMNDTDFLPARDLPPMPQPEPPPRRIRIDLRHR